MGLKRRFGMFNLETGLERLFFLTTLEIYFFYQIDRTM